MTELTDPKNPVFLEFDIDIAGSEIPVRILRETAEQDADVERLNGTAFRDWKVANYERILRSALHIALQHPVRLPAQIAPSS